MPDPSDSARPPAGSEAMVQTRPEEDDGRAVMLPPEPGEVPAGMVDERYRVESELGRGAMGVVYLATEVWLERPVALKVIAPALLGDAGATLRFHREAKALASVKSHHVVQLYAFGLHRGSYFYAMEYVAGRSLKHILAEHHAHGGTLAVHRTLTIVTQIAEGIDAVHAAGIVHRDVKPSNVIIEDDTGRPVLVDFGLAAPSEDRVLAAAVGTPRYMAPEQTGRIATPVTARTDVYALGCTAFEMLTGHPPFHDPDVERVMAMHAEQPAPLVSSIRPQLVAFDRPLARALSKAPAERYESCTAFAEDLATAGAGWRTAHLTSRPPPLPVEEDAPFRVLVVDVEPSFGKFVAQAVHLAFYQQQRDRKVQIQNAGSADEAIELAEIEPPVMVVLDLDVPDLDGAEAVSRLRAVPGASHSRVVVLSRLVQPEDRVRFAALGVRDFVLKPVSFMQLVKAFQGVVERLTGSVPSSRSGAPPR
jgi:serine/threonine-protein kinase